ncbi:LysR family transcriptional regulator [Vibrio amylolyticus]|uniref:LysR family transcriptional regulator n=1 Tax=Vibrio amylolyticus TaxID=2847292 RepID=UPI00354DCCB8
MQTEDLKIVLKVSELKSISSAAASLDLSVATASAAVKRIENQLGAELFVRTTRHLRLSSVGERYIPQCKQALQMLEKAKLSMKEELEIVDGEMRIAASSDLGRNLANDWLNEFMDLYPKIELRTFISDSNVDFYRDSIDMALRYGAPKDSNLYGFKICNVPRLLCASQAYLDKYGTPNTVGELANHNALLYQLHDVLHDTWEFKCDGILHKVKLKGNRSSNDADLVRRWCVAGHGIAIKSCLDMAQDILDGNVVHLLPDSTPAPTELWLVAPSRQSITPGVRLLRDMFRIKSEAVLMELVDAGAISKNTLNEYST